MPAQRKLDRAAVAQIVAGKALGRSDRQIAAALRVSHTTVSRRIDRDRELQELIAAAEAAVGEDGAEGRLAPAVGTEQPLSARPPAGIERQLWDRAMQSVVAQPSTVAATPLEAAAPLKQGQPAPVAGADRSQLRALGFTTEAERHAYYEARALISEQNLLDWHDVRAGRLIPAETRRLRARP